MPALARLSVLAFAIFLTACTSTSQREYEGCIVGMTVLGGAVGASSSGAGVVAGGAVGALASGVVCKPYEEPVVAAADDTLPAVSSTCPFARTDCAGLYSALLALSDRGARLAAVAFSVS